MRNQNNPEKVMWRVRSSDNIEGEARSQVAIPEQATEAREHNDGACKDRPLSFHRCFLEDAWGDPQKPEWEYVDRTLHKQAQDEHSSYRNGG
jgi:hypothetical protein